MTSVTVLYKQTIQDIAIQETGTLLSVISICAFNNLSLTQFLEVGTVIKIPDNVSKDADVLRYFKNREILPATAPTSNQLETTKQFDPCNLCACFL